MTLPYLEPLLARTLMLRRAHPHAVAGPSQQLTSTANPGLFMGTGATPLLMTEITGASVA